MLNWKHLGVLSLNLIVLFFLAQCQFTLVTPQYETDELRAFRQTASEQIKINSRFVSPEGFPKFVLSDEYPTQIPEPEEYPWLQYNFKTQPEIYIQAVLEYALDGNVNTDVVQENIDIDWQIQDNKIRKWYHAPWMHWGRNGREPIHGLTRERGSRTNELSENQIRRTNNWAVGFYNPVGGYTIGQVWKDPSNPNSSLARFHPGTVSVKLLFTDASDEEAPFLAGENSLKWHAQIDQNEPPTIMRLLQVDIAVRDERADEYTGWIFGTFMYDANQNGQRYWDNLVPVGLQWGNDPEFKLADYLSGDRPQEGWINPYVAQLMQQRPPRGDLGYLGRVNGPVDNPFSSCLACHSRALDSDGGDGPSFTPRYEDMCIERVRTGEGPNRNETYRIINDCIPNETNIAIFFRNLKPDEPFIDDTVSLDYSLQLAAGIANWYDWRSEEFSNLTDSSLVDENLSRIRSFAAPAFDQAISEDIFVPLLPRNEAFSRAIEEDSSSGE